MNKNIYADKPLQLIQISDCHLGNQEGDTLLGLNADLSLDLLLSEMASDFSTTDLLVCSGDLSNEAGTAAFERLLAKIPQSLRQAWLPGNHDDNQQMQEALREHQGGHEFLPTISIGDWQITLLDSSIAGKVPGLLSDAELSRALHVLERYPHRHHLFFLHHHLLPIGCKWLDWQVVANAEDVLNRFATYPQLKAIVNGHVHQENHQEFQHIQLYSSPSTSIQFKTNSDEFMVDTLMPGLRWFRLHSNGEFETGVKRISETEFAIDRSAAGY